MLSETIRGNRYHGWAGKKPAKQLVMLAIAGRLSKD